MRKELKVDEGLGLSKGLNGHVLLPALGTPGKKQCEEMIKNLVWPLLSLRS